MRSSAPGRPPVHHRRTLAVVITIAVTSGALSWLAPADLRAQLAPAPPISSGQSSASPPAGGNPGGLLAPAPAAVRGRYLDATPAVIRDPKTRKVTLVVDVVPKAGMRVYAPGNKDYKPVDLQLDAAAGLTAGATQYPKAEDFLFVPLNERVKVYTSAFRLTRDVAGAAITGAAPASDAAPARSLTGRLEYQACDDKVCYLPQTLALTWSLK